MSETEEPREPLVHAVELSAQVVGRATITAKESVTRGLNETRLAVLGILVGIALTVGFGIPGSAWIRIAGGVASFIVACTLIKWGTSRHYLMAFMHWLTDK